MIVLGIILLILAAYLPPVLPLPDPIYPLAHIAGVLLLIIGVILLILSLFGRPVGNGWGPTVGGRRYWY